MLRTQLFYWLQVSAAFCLDAAKKALEQPQENGEDDAEADKGEEQADSGVESLNVKEVKDQATSDSPPTEGKPQKLPVKTTEGKKSVPPPVSKGE